MKKVTIIFTIFCMTIAFSYAQGVVQFEKATNERASFKTPFLLDVNQAKDAFEPVWQVTFDEAVPTWTMSHTTGTTKDWVVGDDASRPCYWGPVNTDGTGWWVFSMDYIYESAGLTEGPGTYAYIDIAGDRATPLSQLPAGCTMPGTGQAAFDAWIQFDNLDLSAVGIPSLKFYNSYRASNPTFFGCYVEYSLNGGTSWTSVAVNKPSELDDMGFNNGEYALGLVACANQADVSLRFRHSSDASFDDWSYPSSWAWMIDDVRLYDYADAPAFDLVIDDTRVNFFQYTDYTLPEYAGYLVYHSSSHYSQVPAAQFEADNAYLWFNISLENNGSAAVTPKVNVKVYNPQNTLIFDEVVVGNVIGYTGTDTLDMIGINCEILDPIIGKYLIVYNAFSEGNVDNTPENNVDTAYFYVSENTFSREADDITGRMTAANWSNGGSDGDGIGTRFLVMYGDTIQSVDVFIDSLSTSHSFIQCEIYEYTGDGNPWISVSQSDVVEITEEDRGAWLSIVLFDEYIIDFVEGETARDILVGINMYYNANDIYIGESNANNHSQFSTYWKFTTGGNAGEWNPISNYSGGPAIRLNYGSDNNAVNPVYNFSETQSICDGDVYSWHGTNYNNSGVYTANYTTIHGCDSIYELNLIVNPGYNFSETQSICDGEVYSWRGTNYSNAGVYTASYTTIHGCDSIYELNLIVNPGYEFVTTQNICAGESYEWRGNDYIEENTYTETYHTQVGGCDSIYKLELIVNPLPQQVVIIKTPSNGLLAPDNYGQIKLSTSITGTVYWVTMGASLYTSEIAGNGNILSLGTTFIAGTYDVWARNAFGCVINLGSVSFVQENGNNQIIANVTFGVPATNFAEGEILLTLYRTTLDVGNNPVITLENQVLLGSNGQAIFENIDVGSYYLSSSIVHPINYTVVSHVYYQNSMTHEDATNISVTENMIFNAHIHHQQLEGGQGSNTGGGIVVSESEGKSIIPEPDMVVILRNDDANQIIDVCVTNLNGEYSFETIPDDTNIKMYVTSFEYQQWIPYTVHTTTGQEYIVNFIIEGNSVYPEGATGIPNLELSKFEFNIYPNPAKDVLYITNCVENCVMKIYDINGKLVQTNTEFTNNEISISNLASGAYVLILTSESGKTGVQEFVKE
ncbi:MAG: T9SS type A sorting domain-containing protein [Bacteroidales bacterium]|nr:T9SS type A sorting domain-containing protein [Bacteroidales bacterium]